MIGQTISHYQIESKLGEGGMGVVYKARDLTLERFVALKFLAPHLAASDSARNRLLREARAISALDHPNIATIYEIEADGDDLFLALEYLPGGTLRSRLLQLQAGGMKLSLQQLLAYAGEMGAGLAFAHRNGICHRDVKTSNALLSGTGVVKLTDFGLAKFYSGSQLTPAGARLGTAAYMAPEQAVGAETDRRSDIFSFGVVLYELATGELPFQTQHDAALVYQILNTSPPPLGQHRPDLPQELGRVIERALEKRPEDRYQSMDELLDDLLAVGGPVQPASRGRCSTAVTATMEPAAAGLWKRRIPRRRLALWIAPALALGMAAFLLWPGRAAVSEGSSVLLAEVINRTGDQQLNAVTDLLRAQLGQSAYFNLVDTSRVREVLQRMVRSRDEPLTGETAREVAWRSGIPVVISGTLSQLGSGYILNLYLERIGDRPAPVRAFYGSFEAAGKNPLFDAVRRGGNWARRIAGENAQDLARRDRQIEETTTNSWEALDLYSRAERLKLRDRQEDAVVLLRHAVKIDPDFALAYALMGDILVAFRKEGEGYRCYKRALQSLGARRLSQREELRIRGLYAIDTGDPRSADDLFRSYSLYYPNDYYPVLWRGLSLRQQGREDDAIQQFREAEKKEPTVYYMPAQLAMSYLARGRFTDAAAEIDRLRRLKQDDWANFLEGVSAYLQGDYARAADRLSGLRQSQSASWRSRSYLLEACLSAERGEYSKAIRLLGEGIALDSREGQATSEADKLLALAYLEYRRQRFGTAQESCLRAVRLDSSPHRLLKAGTLLARMGATAQAQQLLPELSQEEANVFQSARRRITGEILLARGSKAQALEEFRQADALEAPARPREYLARGMAYAGDLQGAFDRYASLVQAQRALWRSPDEHYPGLWADALFQYARLAAELGKKSESESALLRYLRLREKADDGTADVKAARELMAKLANHANGERSWTKESRY
jgi:predicted negative regulator of RcsB-dependent stress response